MIKGSVVADPPVDIRRDLLLEVYRQARLAFPSECCGWLIGQRAPNRAQGIRPANNAQRAAHRPLGGRGVEQAYAIEGGDLLAFCGSLDSALPALVVYHSHTNGAAYFSATDRRMALDPWGTPLYPVQQLVVGIDAAQISAAKLFAWDEQRRAFIEVACYPGAAI